LSDHTHDTAPTRFLDADGIRFAYRRFGRGTGVAALDPDNEVALIRPDGTYRTVLTGRDGPTSAAVRDGRLYVLSAAFLTGQDPNILVADIDSDAATRA
jgi:hypothetical protein